MAQAHSYNNHKINLKLLSEAAINELMNYYEYLVFKYSDNQKKIKHKKRFSKFLSSPVRVDNFIMMSEMKETKDKIFIDTNIFVYAKLENLDAFKHKKAKTFLSEITSSVAISIQVINEFYNVLSKNKVADLTIQNAITAILEDVSLGLMTLSTIHIAWEIRKKYHYSYYDCLIIAVALENNCAILYSEDLQNNQIINGKLKIINPLL